MEDTYEIEWDEKIDGINYCTIGKAAKYLGRTTLTIKNWAEWYELQPDYIKKDIPFPEFKRDISKKRPIRYISEEGVKLLEEFKSALVYGKMKDISRTKWAKK